MGVCVWEEGGLYILKGLTLLCLAADSSLHRFDYCSSRCLGQQHPSQSSDGSTSLHVLGTGPFCELAAGWGGGGAGRLTLQLCSVLLISMHGV
jgi:hypothetical protein